MSRWHRRARVCPRKMAAQPPPLVPDLPSPAVLRAREAEWAKNTIPTCMRIIADRMWNIKPPIPEIIDIELPVINNCVTEPLAMWLKDNGYTDVDFSGGQTTGTAEPATILTIAPFTDGSDG